MATTDSGGRDERAGTRLTLDAWHPNCWALEATSRTDGGVLAHAVYTSPRTDGDVPNSSLKQREKYDGELNPTSYAISEIVP